jgi:hypothetical protein
MEKQGPAKINNLLSLSYPSLFIPSLVCLLLHHTRHSSKMPISKKDRIHREHKKAEAAGTRIPVNPNGTPVKPKKATSICVFCKKEIVSLDYAQKALKVTSVLRVDGSNFRAPEQPMNRRHSADTRHFRPAPTSLSLSSMLVPTPMSGPRRSAGPTTSSKFFTHQP